MLKDFDVDVLKIDREFLNNAEISERAKYVLAQIITCKMAFKRLSSPKESKPENRPGFV